MRQDEMNKNKVESSHGNSLTRVNNFCHKSVLYRLHSTLQLCMLSSGGQQSHIQP